MMESERIHRRQTARGIVAPIVLGLLALVAAVGVSVWLVARSAPAGQLSLVADVLVVLCMLVPMAICLLPAYLLFMVAAFGTGALHKASAKQLRRLNQLSRTITDKSIDVTEAVNQRTLNARVRVAGVEAFMESAFEKPENDERQDNNDPTNSP